MNFQTEKGLVYDHRLLVGIYAVHVKNIENEMAIRNKVYDIEDIWIINEMDNEKIKISKS